MRSTCLKRAKNKQSSASPRARGSRNFIRDFAPLEAALARSTKIGGSVMTPEQMIVELHLTPPLVRRIECQYWIRLPWFVPAYAILKRHRLMPSARTRWEGWLKSYRQRRTEAKIG